MNIRNALKGQTNAFSSSIFYFTLRTSVRRLFKCLDRGHKPFGSGKGAWAWTEKQILDLWHSREAPPAHGERPTCDKTLQRWGSSLGLRTQHAATSASSPSTALLVPWRLKMSPEIPTSAVVFATLRTSVYWHLLNVRALSYNRGVGQASRPNLLLLSSEDLTHCTDLLHDDWHLKILAQLQFLSASSFYMCYKSTKHNF